MDERNASREPSQRGPAASSSGAAAEAVVEKGAASSTPGAVGAAGAARPLGGAAAGGAGARTHETPPRAAAWASQDVLRAATLIFALYLGLQLVWMVHPVLLTGFVGLLFGLGAARGADHLERFHVPRGIAAAAIVLATYAALAGVLAIAAPTLEKQFGELRQRLPEAMDRIDQWAAANKGNVWGEMLAGAGGNDGATGATAAPASGALPLATPAARADKTGGTSKAGHGGGDHGAAGTKSAKGGGAEAQAAAGAGTGGADAGATPGGDGSGKAAATTVSATAAAGGTGAQAAVTTAPAATAAKASTSARPGAAPAAPNGAGAPKAASPLREKLARQLGAATHYLFPFLSSTVEVLAGLLLITFVAIYFSVDPGVYRRGMLHLVPHDSRERADEVLTAIGITLRKWLMTQLIAMVVIGGLVYVTLALMGVEAALSLGIIAGVLEFIPTIGPILASVPAIAMGFVVSPEKALAVAIAFTLVQMLEGHLLIPMLMKRGMNLPPLITILGQALMAVIFGFLGLLVAVPLIAVILTTVKMLYVNDVMGDGLRTGTGVK